jgi:hypothetical protein
LTVINKEIEERFSSREIAVFMNLLNYELNLLGLCDINLNNDTNWNYQGKN